MMHGRSSIVELLIPAVFSIISRVKSVELLTPAVWRDIIFAKNMKRSVELLLIFIHAGISDTAIIDRGKNIICK